MDTSISVEVSHDAELAVYYTGEIAGKQVPKDKLKSNKNEQRITKTKNSATTKSGIKRYTDK